MGGASTAMRNNTKVNHSSHSVSWRRTLLLTIAATTTLTACVAPPTRAYRAAPPPEPSSSLSAATVYVYPANGQSDAQLDRDRYECNAWSVKQSGYDPSQVHADAERVNVVVGPPPGTSTVTGAFTGALLGAAVSGPRQAGGGAIIGAIAGAMLGATADAGRQEQADAIQQSYDRRTASAVQQAESYRRAISACLEGRGYTVK